MVVDVAALRDHIADFDDFFRPMRNYFYWEPHCVNIPVCWAIRSMFDSLDGIDTMTDAIQSLLPDMDRLDALLPQMLALMPSNIATMKTMKTMMQTQYQSQKGMQDQMAAMQDDQTEMGKAFDTAKNDDTFYLPPEIFDNADFKRGMKSFLSPDGHAVRFIISHEGDPMTARRHLTHRRHQAGGQGGDQGHAAGRLQDPSRRHRGDLQGHAGRQQLRPDDRRHLGARPDLHHHAADHAQHRRRGGDRRHRGAVVGCVVRTRRS